MTKHISTHIPYVDNVLASLVHPEFERAYGRHMHLGYWPDPSKADGSVEDFARAGEIMAALVCRAAGVQSGHRVLPRPPLPDPGGVNVQGYMEGEDALALTSACSKWP